MRTATLVLVLALVLTGCATTTAGLPVDDQLGSLGEEDPSIVVAKVITININSGMLTVDVRKVDGKDYFRRGVRVEADGRTVFVNRTSYEKIDRITEIPGTIVEIEGYNDHGIYRALTIALIEIPPEHPVWQPYTK